MLDRLIVEGVELDLVQELSNLLSYSVDDVRNIDSKGTPISKTIVLPGTSVNNKALGNIFDIHISNLTDDGEKNIGYNFNAARVANCRYEVNGMVVIKGTFRLLEIIQDGKDVEYEAQIIGELGAFVSKLANKRIEELDFSDYDHTFGVTQITSSWDRNYVYELPSNSYTINSATKKIKIINRSMSMVSAGDTITVTGTASNNGSFTVVSVFISRAIFDRYTEIEVSESVVTESGSGITIEALKGWGRGFYYPLIDFGNVSTNKHDFQYTAFRPALFMREYIDKIITGAGYTYDSDFMDTDFIKRIIIPNNNKGLLNQDNTFYVQANNTSTFYREGDGIQSFFLQFGSQSMTGFSIDPTNYLFTYTSPSVINTKIKLKLSGKYRRLGLVLGTMSVRVFSTRAQKTYNFPVQSTYSDFDVTIEMNSEFQTGDILDFRVNYIGNVSDFGPLLIESAELSVEKDPPGGVELPLGSPIKMNNQIPKGIYQRDLFVSFLKMFNLHVTEDRYKERHLKFEPYPSFYQTGNYEDWSDKLNHGAPKRIKPMSELNARFYQFKYKQDNDFYNESYRKKFNEGYGDRIFDSSYEFAKDTDSLEVIFSSTVLFGTAGEDKVFPAIYKKSGNGGFEETIEHNIRVMQAKKITGVNSWKILDGSTTVATLTDYGYAGHLDDPDAPNADINFGAPKELYFALASGNISNNLFNTYYSPYMAEITDKDSKLLTAEFRLTTKDVFQLDFTRLKYIDGALFRLVKVNDWNTNGKENTKCELLKVIYAIY